MLHGGTFPFIFPLFLFFITILFFLSKQLPSFVHINFELFISVLYRSLFHPHLC